MSRFISIVLIIILSPFLILTIIISLIMHGSPVFFKQPRVGRGGSVFIMYKFRTMKNNTPEDVATHLLDDPKKYNTRFGSLLRKYSIDEFPQLFNIFKGDMKFIGPRPALANQKDLNHLRTVYGTINCTPGVTGWAQVNGRDKNSILQKAEMELWYENNKSFLLDLKIICLTIKNFIVPSGIYPDN